MKFELKVVDEDITSGMIQVGWCVTPELIEYLKENDYQDPAIVLVVKNKGRESEVRQVARLSDLVTYVGFKYSGETNIYAFISESYKGARNRYLSKDKSRFSTTIISGDEWSYIFDRLLPDLSDSEVAKLSDEEAKAYYHDKYKRSPSVYADILTVDIPQSAFAPEPHPWEKAWVNWLMESTVEDQCDFRKRRLFAYTIQPVLLLLNIMIRISLMILCFCFGYKPNLYFLNPFSRFEPSEATTGSFIFIDSKIEAFEKANNNKEPAGKLFLLAFARVPFLPVLFVPLVLSLWYWPLATLAVISFLFVSITVLVFSFTTHLKIAAESKTNWLTKESFKQLTCEQGKPYSFNTLPSNKRSLKLTFNYVKSKICRPFAG